MNVAAILRLESAAVGVLGIVDLLSLGGPPLALVPALLAPDQSMLGYLAGPRIGEVSYNLVHNRAVPAGWDRALGYGLKLPSGFRDTHLGRIGRDRPAE